MDVDTWRRLPWWSRLAFAVRAPVLVMTLGSALFGAALAWRDAHVDGTVFAVVLVGLLLAHATNNLLNDWVDYRRGVDSPGYYRVEYGVHALAHGLMTKRAFLTALFGVGAGAAVCAAILTAVCGSVVILPIALGSVALLFYTWPLKQLALGEVTVLAVWGPLMIGGTYAAIAGAWSWPVAFASCALALGPSAVIFAKHIDKRAADVGKGVYTLPAVLGDQRARAITRWMLAIQVPLLIALAVVGDLPWTTLLVLLAFPTLVRAWRALCKTAPTVRPPDFPGAIWPLWQVAYVFDYVRRATLLLMFGFALDVAWSTGVSHGWIAVA